MGRALMEMCKLLNCLPSELYEKHDPTIGDFLAISTYTQILKEEENERLNSIMGASK